MTEEKAALRKLYRKLRRQHEERTESGKILFRNCIASITFRDSDIVSGYIPIDGEIDILPLMRHLNTNSIITLMPEVEKGNRMLMFKKWSQTNDDNLGDAMVPNLLFIPIVAFDKKLNRLGFGGGYYDYTIKTLRRSGRCRCIGVAYDIQLCDHIPVEQHDQKLDMVITDKKVYVSH